MTRSTLLIQQLITVLLFHVHAQHGDNSSGQNESRKETDISTLESSLTSSRNSAIWPTLMQSTVNDAPIMAATEAKNVLRTYSTAKQPTSFGIVPSQSQSTEFLPQSNSKPEPETVLSSSFHPTTPEPEFHHQPMLTTTAKIARQFADDSAQLAMQLAETPQLRIHDEDSQPLPERSAMKLNGATATPSYQNNAFEDDVERIDEEDDSSSADSVSLVSLPEAYIKNF